MLTRFCALKLPTHRFAALSNSPNSDASDWLTVANAHAVFASSFCFVLLIYIFFCFLCFFVVVVFVCLFVFFVCLFVCLFFLFSSEESEGVGSRQAPSGACRSLKTKDLMCFYDRFGLKKVTQQKTKKTCLPLVFS